MKAKEISEMPGIGWLYYIEKGLRYMLQKVCFVCLHQTAMKKTFKAVRSWVQTALTMSLKRRRVHSNCGNELQMYLYIYGTCNIYCICNIYGLRNMGICRIFL